VTEQGDRGDRGLEGQRGERGDAGAQGDIGKQGDIGNTGKQGDIGDRGDTGKQGVAGPKGERGTDGEGIEVLTQVLDKLTGELVGLREDVRTERRGRRLSLLVIVVALTVATVAAVVGYSNYRGLNRRQVTEQRQLERSSNLNDYDQKLALHEACLRDNGSRQRDRALFLNLYDLVAATPPAMPRTPAEQQVLDDFLEKARLDVINRTPPLDCAVESPRPRGLRPS